MSTSLMDLRSIIPSPCYHRPFVCNGLPQSCTVIVVGENPATRMDTDWWSYWSDETGFDLNKFEDEYRARRLAQGKRAVSNTRLRLNRLRDHGLECLETNIFAREGSDGGPTGEPNARLLRMFLSALPQLKAIIDHGDVARRQLDQIDLPAHLHRFSMRHFRSESYANIDEVAARVANLSPRPSAAP